MCIRDRPCTDWQDYVILNSTANTDKALYPLADYGHIHCMLDNDDFSVWMQKLYAKLEELCKDVRELRIADRVLPEDDNLLDNQDLCLLFEVSIKTLQRYRAIGALPYFTISGKVYYKGSDVREFIKERFSVTTLRQFEKEHCTKKKK